MFKDYPDVVGVKELMEMLNIGRVLAYELVKGKIIKSKKIGREYKILKVDVISFLENANEVAE